MRLELFAAGAMVFVAFGVVRYMERETAALEASNAATAVAIENATETAEAAPDDLSAYYGAISPEVRIPKGPHNQYFVTAAVNKRPASFLVDTGASYVALRASDAAGAGVVTSPRDFSHPVRTANGETRAALVKLRRIEIDGLRVDNVDAFVLPDAQLGMNLLGMSFLSRLESVEARRGELILRG
ncbi:MAG: TIGR02281 family clan AA aspartic protease [Parvularculaceae bacterium]